MKKTILTCAAIAMLTMGQGKLQDDPPPRAAPKNGDIRGTISPAGDIAEVYACNRNTLKALPAEFSKATGSFTVKNLPGDASYDIGVKLKDGRIVEGIDLAPLDARFLRLANERRKALDMPPEEDHAFDREDADSLLKFAEDLKDNDFMNQSRVLYVAGHGRRATMLVELMRTREFYDQKKTGQGVQVIWRIELWYYEYFHGGWERVANQERVLRRERIPSGQWAKIGIEYLPQLSVYIDPAGKSQAVDFKIPEKPDPAAGRPAGTEPKLQTKAHILGLKANPETQPADAKETSAAVAAASRPDAWAKPVEKPGLPNCFQVSGQLYRGAQPAKEGFAQLKAMGIKTVLDLRVAHSNHEEMAGTGMAHEEISMKIWHAEDEDVVRFLKLVTDKTKTPMFVHCAQGSDRTGTLCAVYRIAVQGWSKQDAIREMVEGGYGFHEVLANLTRYINHLDIAKIRKQAGIAEPPNS
jgi:protein tyrosine phosphatase (PTP) superfamily phosphohydrolase (DUF442 family)